MKTRRQSNEELESSFSILESSVSELENESYSDLTGSRSYGVTYTNLSSKTKTIYLYTAIANINSGTLTAIVNGVTVLATPTTWTGAASNFWGAISFQVPAGASYSVTSTNAPSIASWKEFN